MATKATKYQNSYTFADAEGAAEVQTILDADPKYAKLVSELKSEDYITLKLNMNTLGTKKRLAIALKDDTIGTMPG